MLSHFNPVHAKSSTSEVLSTQSCLTFSKEVSLMRTILVCALGVALLCVAPAYAWGPIAHGGIADRMMQDGDIDYALGLWGFSKSNISSSASTGDIWMPDWMHSGQWNNVRTQSQLNASWMAWTINEDYCGGMMHNLGDVSGPTCHCPACDVWCSSGCAELYFEAQGEAYGIPAWPAPYAVDWTNYDGYCAAFYSDQIYWTNRFKDHHNKTWYCKYLCICQTDWIDPYCKENSLQLGWEVFFWYLWYHS